jgi:hypothetical protein
MLSRLVQAVLPRSTIPFDMFALERTASELRAAEKLRSIYHRGQELAWDGREVLQELLARHGGIRLQPEHRLALRRVLEGLLWGELVAWKASAELADRVVPLEAKLALTAQAHDEARHFYVLYDYIKALGYQPEPPDIYTQRLFDVALHAHNVGHKLVGVQLLIENVALTLFAELRRKQIEPVLCELLQYYEKDEARHVGLGTQLLPSVLQNSSRPQMLAMALFQLQMVGWMLASLTMTEPHLLTLGIAAGDMVERAQNKQKEAFGELWSRLIDLRDLEAADPVISAARELFFPLPGQSRAPYARARAAWRVYQQGRSDAAARRASP